MPTAAPPEGFQWEFCGDRWDLAPIDLEDNSVVLDFRAWSIYAKHKEGDVFGGIGVSTPNCKFYDIGFI